MNTNLFKILFVFITFFALIPPGLCTQLPEPVLVFIKEKFPEVNIRFDGYIELPDKTAYLPILPYIYNSPEDPVEIVQTIPADQDFSQMPDMVLFNNNLALLKIIKKEGEAPTVISSPEMPLRIKLGLLPQDLVVPKGLVLSQELKVLLGDLKIPLKEKYDKEGEISFYNKTENNETNPEKAVNFMGRTTENVYVIPELKFLGERKIYTINSRNNKLNVLDPQSGRIIKTIVLPSVPFDMKITPDDRYVLLTGPAVGKLFVVDTTTDEFVKSVDVGKFPSSIASILKKQKAYVANKNSCAISELDIKNMQALKEIPVTGYPDNLEISDKGDFIFYNDYMTGEIYQLNTETAQVTYLFRDKNISKLGHFDKFVLSLSRSENTLTVFDLEKGEIVKKTKIKEKPLDFKILERMAEILVVCAGASELSIIDTGNFDVIKSIPLENNGFPSKIELVSGKAGKTRALITDYDAYEIAIYDIDTEKILGYLPVSDIVGTIIVSE